MRKTLLTALVLGALSAQPAAAAGPFGDYCTLASNGQTVCTSVSTTFFSNASGSFMQVDVQNLQGPDGQGVAHRITGIGLYYQGSGNGMAELVSGPTGAWTNGVPNSFWGNGAGNSAGAGYSLFAGASVANNAGGLYGCTQVGNANGTSTCAAPGVFLFEIADDVTLPAELHFGFRSQAVAPDGGSAKCYSTTPEGQSHGCWTTTTTVTPEPATVMLLASGILGLGGFGLVRRRRETAA